MRSLQQFAQDHPSWTLEEFVQITNELLPQFLPESPGNTRVREEVTPRLVRHYSSLSMLDEPIKAGREARYTYRHLLQMLLVRRLLAEGYGASAINQVAIAPDNAELEALLQGGAKLTVTPANPALAFLQQVQHRQPASAPLERMAPIPVRDAAIQFSPLEPAAASRWTRLEVIPGLEIQVRDDFIYPRSPQEQETLLQAIAQLLLTTHPHRRSPK
ncbi:MAG: MerR family transcriptional regulator [Leptolyngbyaceae bacterium]|nr:MerR family transcriptional regulator [Leptolyngbyaceae bacterium]